jgi:iron complex transport system substrate-binding protein
MRVVTLLPAATEIVAALAPESLAGVSHECDYPAWVTSLPRITRTSVDVGATSAEIDAQVRTLKADGKPVIWVDAAALEALKPDLIVTQGLCEVCAVADGEVFRVAERLDPKPTVLSLGAKTLEGIYEDVRSCGRAVGRPDEADEVVAGMKYKVSQLRKSAPLGHSDPERSEGEESARPRVVVVEWLDPLFLAGHWVPELIEVAGGLDVGAKPGDHSHPRPWSDLLELKPDIIVVALCGFSVERARQEWDSQLPADARRVLAELGFNDRPAAGPPDRLRFLDGNQYTSRPGPRVMEGFLTT